MIEFPDCILQKQEGCTITNNSVNAFGLSLQGASHKKTDPAIPCQDYSGMRWLDKEKILIASIADGVGSCKYSHFGAKIAVNTAIESSERQLKGISSGKELRLDPNNTEFREKMKHVLNTSFQDALDAVESFADKQNPPQSPFFFQSTLTLAIYDGVTLYHGHAGDDGIIVQLSDGNVHMATSRMKGDEANSVYPLQSGQWKFGLVDGEVAGFVMATDGVLDAFVASQSAKYPVAYCNGICYEFMENAMKELSKGTSLAAEKALNMYRDYMESDEYRSNVSDDLTLVAVVSPHLINQSPWPKFSVDEWNEAIEKRKRLIEKELRETPEPEISEIYQDTDCVPENSEDSNIVELPDEDDDLNDETNGGNIINSTGLAIIAISLLMLVLGMLLGWLAFGKDKKIDTTIGTEESSLPLFEKEEQTEKNPAETPDIEIYPAEKKDADNDEEIVHEFEERDETKESSKSVNRRHKKTEPAETPSTEVSPAEKSNVHSNENNKSSMDNAPLPLESENENQLSTKDIEAGSKEEYHPDKEEENCS